MISRIILNPVTAACFQKKAVIIYGARQVGKTTLVKEIMNHYREIPGRYLNCDEPDIRAALSNKTSTELKILIGNAKLVIIDEAQRVENIGISLKLLVDNYPDIQVIATGSSSLDLANKISEPLTGRVFTFRLFPFSVRELASKYSPLELDRIRDTLLIHGSYPDVIVQPELAATLLPALATSYLYKDILTLGNIRKPELFEKLLTLLALQVGNEVSYSELAQQLEVSKQTVEGYVRLLEDCFILFRLFPYHSNKRNELTRKCKIYFWDNGIRNALIRNFNPAEIRNDTGALWENYLISERMKLLSDRGGMERLYFWRTVRQEEVDLLEEENRVIQAFEFKWSVKEQKPPKAFRDAYPDTVFSTIHPGNWLSFCGLPG